MKTKNKHLSAESKNPSIEKIIASYPSQWKKVTGGIGFEAWEVTTPDGIFNVEVELQDPDWEDED